MAQQSRSVQSNQAQISQHIDGLIDMLEEPEMIFTRDQVMRVHNLASTKQENLPAGVKLCQQRVTDLLINCVQDLPKNHPFLWRIERMVANLKVGRSALSTEGDWIVQQQQKAGRSTKVSKKRVGSKASPRKKPVTRKSPRSK